MNQYYLLDACALLAYLHNEQGADQVEKILLENNISITLHIIN